MTSELLCELGTFDDNIGQVAVRPGLTGASLLCNALSLRPFRRGGGQLALTHPPHGAWQEAVMGRARGLAATRLARRGVRPGGRLLAAAERVECKPGKKVLRHAHVDGGPARRVGDQRAASVLRPARQLSATRPAAQQQLGVGGQALAWKKKACGAIRIRIPHGAEQRAAGVEKRQQGIHVLGLALLCGTAGRTPKGA